MALITVSGEAGCRHQQVARLAADRLEFELVTESRLDKLIGDEFGSVDIPPKAYRYVAAFLLTRLATEHHLVVSIAGAELLFKDFPAVMRVFVTAPEGRRVGNVMVDRRIDRPAARKLLREIDGEAKRLRRERFGRSTTPPYIFDLILGSELFDNDQMAALIEAASKTHSLVEHGLLSPSAEAEYQFQVRLHLAKHGILPLGKASLKRRMFANRSEEIFASLLDFYRVAWEYEPRSFPVKWDENGKPVEFVTPDFYLPEFDLYVELTTMKQSLVTKKNRKIKLLRTIYPDINIQVFYQKDFQNLVFKYGLAERVVPA